MSDNLVTQKCQCPCGKTQFTVTGLPLVRGLCHCTICQEFTGHSHADIVAVFSKQVDLPDPGLVDFQAYKPPPAVQRGKCKACGKGAVEFLDIPLFPKLTIIPSANFVDQSTLPEPTAHLFYRSRVADVNDQLPKHNGFLASQWAFCAPVLGALFRRQR